MMVNFAKEGRAVPVLKARAVQGRARRRRNEDISGFETGIAD
jgi:hypothetical protein